MISGDPLFPDGNIALPFDAAFRVGRVRAFVYRAPVEKPVITSFGVMHDRPAVLVQVEADDGSVGWGEIWANFPACGAEHRARLATSELAPRLQRAKFGSPADAFRCLERAVRTLALQSGEWGPLAQSLAGIDIALWDLVTRRAGVPLARAFGRAATGVPVYASGINLDDASETVARCRNEGYRAFKVKVGFGHERDLAGVREVAQSLAPDEDLMLDANQAWDLRRALAMGNALAEFAPRWLEEPIPADRPLEEWTALAGGVPIALAGGENLRGLQAFVAAIEAGALRVIQPDACKWGGITGCLSVAQAALAAGRRYCPHFLGGGVGLIASAHLLAAAGGDGVLEVDANPNPLREVLAAPFPRIDSALALPEGSGLGVAPDLEQARRWLVLQLESR